MKRIFRRLLQWMVLTLFVVAGVVVINTITFSSKQLKVEALSPREVPGAVVQRLSQAVRYPTNARPAAIDTPAFRAMLAFLDSQFVLVDSFLEKDTIGGFSLLYHWPGRDTSLLPILLTGHLDVVPVEAGSSAAWSEAPYGGAVKRGYIWGRGTLDDKVAVLGILEAAELLLADGYRPQRTIYFAFGHDEEARGRQGAGKIAEHFRKNDLWFEYVLDEGLVQLEEVLPGLEKPVSLVGIAEKGYVTLSLSVRLPKGGHSALPPRETAIGILSDALARLEDHPLPARLDGATRQLFSFLGPEMPLGQKAVFANLWLFQPLILRKLAASPVTNAAIRTTTAITMIRGGIQDNVLPTTASAKVNFRILPGESVETVKAHVRKAVADERVVVQVDDPELADNPSPLSPVNAFGFKVIQRSAHEVFPEALVAPSLVVVASDARYYTAVSDHVYRFLPVRLSKSDLQRIHGIDERVSVEGYKDVVRFYYRLLENSTK